MSTLVEQRPGDHTVIRRRQLGSALIGAAVAYLCAAALMGLVAASSPPAALLDDLAGFERGLTLYRLGFVGASLLAPIVVVLLVLLVTAAGVPVGSARRWVGSILLAAYVPLATIAYTSQYAILPDLVARDPEAVAAWYFHDVASIPYALDLAGYALLGLAAIVFASALAEQERRWLAGWLTAMGSLSVVAFVLHASGLETAGGIVSVASAALTLPVAVLAIAEGWRLRTRRRSGPMTLTSPGIRGGGRAP
jgi:hypothetical protein